MLSKRLVIALKVVGRMCSNGAGEAGSGLCLSLPICNVLTLVLDNVSIASNPYTPSSAVIRADH